VIMQDLVVFVETGATREAQLNQVHASTNTSMMRNWCRRLYLQQMLPRTGFATKIHVFHTSPKLTQDRAHLTATSKVINYY